VGRESWKDAGASQSRERWRSSDEEGPYYLGRDECLNMGLLIDRRNNRTVTKKKGDREIKSLLGQKWLSSFKRV